eukprot:TRINITY_DN6310_c0_g1_i1.p1 TRINITY_DN6310_c0_g1~~TRINITY_DN6310_c0_g1_i1.p1  ORF type:complete len:259 (+),score=57.69 TRINITY_DN6310_c0_g1_i1:47-823(+)
MRWRCAQRSTMALYRDPRLSHHHAAAAAALRSAGRSAAVARGQRAAAWATLDPHVRSCAERVDAELLPRPRSASPPAPSCLGGSRSCSADTMTQEEAAAEAAVQAAQGARLWQQMQGDVREELDLLASELSLAQGYAAQLSARADSIEAMTSVPVTVGMSMCGEEWAWPRGGAGAAAVRDHQERCAQLRRLTDSILGRAELLWAAYRCAQHAEQQRRLLAVVSALDGGEESAGPEALHRTLRRLAEASPGCWLPKEEQ